MKKSERDRFQTGRIIILAIAVLYLLAGHLHLEMLWGINHLKYLPGYAPFVIALAVVVGIFTGPLTSLLGAFQFLNRKFSSLSLRTRLILVTLAAAGLFYLLRVKVHALGDGYQRIYQIERGYYFYPAEALDFFLHAAFFRLFRLFTAVPAETIYIAFSILCGIVFILLIYRLYSSIKSSDQATTLLPFLLSALGGSVLFFGYVESYSLYYPAVLLYLLFSLQYLERERYLHYGAVCLSFAILSHQSALFLLPSFLLLLLHFQRKTNVPLFHLLPAAPVIISLTILIGIEIYNRLNYSEYLRSFGENFLPLFSGEYPAFSAVHFLDLANLLLLIFPLAPLFIYLALRPGVSQVKLPDDSRWFLWAVLAGALFFLIFVDPKLGMPRDWDLFATPAAALSFVLIAFAVRRSQMGSLERFRVGYFALLFFSLWVAINASEPRQLERAESVLKLSPKGQDYGTELLAFHYRNKLNNSPKALALFQSIKGRGRNARVLSSIAQMQLELGQVNQALSTAREGLPLDSSGALHAVIGSILLRLDSVPSALPHLMKAIELSPQTARNFYLLGQAYYRLENDTAAISAFKSSLTLDPSAFPAMFSIGQAYLRQGLLDSAYVYIEAGLRLNPKDQQAWELMNFIRSQRR